MSNLKLILYSLIISQNVCGQFAFNNIELKLEIPLSSSYRIIQTEKGKIKKILEFDNNGKIIFDYRETEIPPFFKWKEPHRFIYANKYDKSGRIIKRYDFNSNAGLTIYTYEHGDNPMTKTIYEQKYADTKKVKMNTNPYAFISKFKNLEQLKKSKEVANIISSPKIKLYIEVLNPDNKPIERKEYSKMYNDTIITSIKYNSKGKELFKRIFEKNTNETKREIISEYNSNSTNTEIRYFKNGKKTSTYRYAEKTGDNTKTDYSERKGILNIRHYTYNNKYLIKVSVFETKFKGNLIVNITPNLTKTSEMIYKYNKKGLLEKETMTNYKTGKKDIRKYKYKIVRK